MLAADYDIATDQTIVADVRGSVLGHRESDASAGGCHLFLVGGRRGLRTPHQSAVPFTPAFAVFSLDPGSVVL